MSLVPLCRELFMEALSGLEVAQAMRNRVVQAGGEIVIGEQTYPMNQFRRVIVISVGKAAIAMANALLSQLEPAMTKGQTFEGIVVGRSASQPLDQRLQFFEGEHPFPGDISLAAADSILQLLSGCDQSCLVFFLISGGASAMIERPLGDFSSAEVADFHRALIHSGLPIAQMNVLRKHFSRVKGGRLAVEAQAAARQCTMLISDVPNDMLHVVGSGPSLPDPSTVADCRDIIACNRTSLDLSGRVLDFFLALSLPETPKSDDPAFAKAQWISLLSSNDLSHHAARAAEARGFHVATDNGCDDWDYRDAADYLLRRLAELHKEYARVCLLSAGEVSVQVTARHGTGGRNQQFALECARLLAGGEMNAAILSGGSDGVDGNSHAAGAVCDRTTFARAAALGIDPLAALEHFDSAKVFAALGDAIVTGPTGNNVRDLRILLAAK